MKIAGRQIRRVVDALGVSRYYATPMRDYGDPKLNRCVELIPEIFWEIVSQQEAANGKWRMEFRRLAARRGEDELFEGPKLASTADAALG
jgi:hypothetical protein